MDSGPRSGHRPNLGAQRDEVCKEKVKVLLRTGASPSGPIGFPDRTRAGEEGGAQPRWHVVLPGK